MPPRAPEDYRGFRDYDPFGNQYFYYVTCPVDCGVRAMHPSFFECTKKIIRRFSKSGEILKEDWVVTCAHPRFGEWVATSADPPAEWARERCTYDYYDDGRRSNGLLCNAGPGGQALEDSVQDAKNVDDVLDDGGHGSAPPKDDEGDGTGPAENAQSGVERGAPFGGVLGSLFGWGDSAGEGESAERGGSEPVVGPDAFGVPPATKNGKTATGEPVGSGGIARAGSAGASSAEIAGTDVLATLKRDRPASSDALRSGDGSLAVAAAAASSTGARDPRQYGAASQETGTEPGVRLGGEAVGEVIGDSGEWSLGAPLPPMSVFAQRLIAASAGQDAHELADAPHNASGSWSRETEGRAAKADKDTEAGDEESGGSVFGIGRGGAIDRIRAIKSGSPGWQRSFMVGAAGTLLVGMTMMVRRWL